MTAGRYCSKLGHFQRNLACTCTFGLPVNMDTMSGESEELNRDVQKNQGQQQPKWTREVQLRLF